jgi:hypothetical protein
MQKQCEGEMPANRRDRKLRGTFKQAQAAPELAYERPAPGKLNAEQRALLRLRPKDMPADQHRIIGRAIRDAAWLQPGDMPLLLAWAAAVALHGQARAELDRCFAAADLDGIAHWSRISSRAAAQQIAAGHKLGFSPAGRLALGITTQRPQPRDSADPWSQLKLLRGGRPADSDAG